MATRTVPILSDAEARAFLSHRTAINVIETVYADYGRARRVLSDPPAMLMSPLREGEAAFKIKGGHVPAQGIAGFRMIADRMVDGQEVTQDYCWIADAKTGALRGLVEETSLHRLRTAMTSVVALRWLARPDSRVATIIGAGNIADELPEGLRAVFDLNEIRIVSRRLASAQAFAARHAGAGRVTAHESVAAAVDGADIVITVSTAEKPLISASHLAPGMTVCALGAGPELAADIPARADRLVVDDLAYALTIGSVKGWRDAGVSTDELRSRLSADIGELALDRGRGRRAPDEVVVAVIQGMACCDVALASHALEQARVRSSAG